MKKKPIPAAVIRDVQAEREYQLTRGAEGKLPGQTAWDYTFDDKNTPNDWAAFIAIYVGRAVNTSNTDITAEFRKNMVKVAALALAAVEAVDRVGTPRRHYDKP